MSKFNVGDHVIVNDVDEYHFLQVGTDAVIEEVTEDFSPSYGQVYRVEGLGKGGYPLDQYVAEDGLMAVDEA